MREEIGNNLVKLFKKAAKGTRLKDVTIGDAFVTATMAAVLANAEASLSQEELTMCTNIILKLLPFDKLEAAGVTSKTLRRLSSDRALLRKLREACGPRAEAAFDNPCFRSDRSREIFILSSSFLDLRSSWLDSECVSMDCSIRPWSRSPP